MKEREMEREREREREMARTILIIISCQHEARTAKSSSMQLDIRDEGEMFPVAAKPSKATSEQKEGRRDRQTLNLH
jgi:hypothetical protein